MLAVLVVGDDDSMRDMLVDVTRMMPALVAMAQMRSGEEAGAGALVWMSHSFLERWRIEKRSYEGAVSQGLAYPSLLLPTQSEGLPYTQTEVQRLGKQRIRGEEEKEKKRKKKLTLSQQPIPTPILPPRRREKRHATALIRLPRREQHLARRRVVLDGAQLRAVHHLPVDEARPPPLLGESAGVVELDSAVAVGGDVAPLEGVLIRCWSP